MKKNMTVRISGRRNELGSPAEILDIITTGTLEKDGDGLYRITYAESELGFLGAETTLRVNEASVLITRNMMPHSMLTVEKGQRHLCHYDTGHGQLLIGTYGEIVQADLNDSGGEVSLKYTLDINSAYRSKNELKIEINEI